MTSATHGAGLSAARCPGDAAAGDLELTGMLARLRKDLSMLPGDEEDFRAGEGVGPCSSLSTMSYPGRMRTSEPELAYFRRRSWKRKIPGASIQEPGPEPLNNKQAYGFLLLSLATGLPRPKFKGTADYG